MRKAGEEGRLMRASVAGSIRVKPSEFKSYEFIWLSLIAVYCMNFLNVGIYLPLLLTPVVCVYFVKNKINVTHLILMSFSFTYSLFLYLYGFESIGKVLLFLVYPTSLYVLGLELVKGDANYKKTFRLLMVVIGAFTFFGFLCLYKTISTYGNIDTAISVLRGRAVLSFWGSNIIGATGLNTFLSLGLSLPFVAFLPNKGGAKFFRLFCLLCFAVSSYCAFTLGNRTGFIIIITSMVSVYLFAGKFGAKKVFILFLVLPVIFVFKFLYDNFFLGLKESFENTLLYARLFQFHLTDDPRFEVWQSAFTGLFEHPLGGRLTELPLLYAHNLWLDVGYTTGIFPFFLLVLFSAVSIKSLVELVVSNAPTILKGLFIALYTAFLTTFFVEPIMEGWFTYFMVFCLIVGMVQRLNFERKSKTQQKPLI